VGRDDGKEKGVGMRSELILLTPADVKKLQEVKAAIDEAIAAKKRNPQIAGLLEAQSKLMNVLHWFIWRDM
jgi:hypothetical protein